VLRWAAERGAVVIEDDYDAEYRYDRTPVGALQGLAPDRVVHAGSASKTLAPGMRRPTGSAIPGPAASSSATRPPTSRPSPRASTSSRVIETVQSIFRSSP